MIYIDLDGVLADLNKWILSIDKNAITDTKAFNLLALNHYERLFMESEPIEENFKLIPKDDEYRILTALPHPQNFFKYGLQEGLFLLEIAGRYATLHTNKITWCVNHGIPASNVIIVPIRRLKQNYCRNNTDILYDDSTKTIKERIEKGGDGRLVE